MNSESKKEYSELYQRKKRIFVVFLRIVIKNKFRTDRHMEKEENQIYARNTLEFVTVALEYCTFVEAAGNTGLFDFIRRQGDKTLASFILQRPTCYLKWDLKRKPNLSFPFQKTCTSEVRSRIAVLLFDERDSCLETFHTRICSIAILLSQRSFSENLADVYQDTGNFVSLFRQGNEEVMQEAIALCRMNFQEYWGQQLLNALKALHAVRYSGDEDLEKNDEEEWVPTIYTYNY